MRTLALWLLLTPALAASLSPNVLQPSSLLAPNLYPEAETVPFRPATEDAQGAVTRAYLIELDGAASSLEHWRNWARRSESTASHAEAATGANVSPSTPRSIARSLLGGVNAVTRRYGLARNETDDWQSGHGDQPQSDRTNSNSTDGRQASSAMLGDDDGAPPVYFKIRHEFDDPTLLLGLSVRVLGYTPHASSGTTAEGTGGSWSADGLSPESVPSRPTPMPDGPSSTGPRGWSQQRDIQLLSTARGVLRVTPVRLVPAPRAWNGLEQVASVSTGSSSSNIRRSNLDMIGVTSLHEEGVNGKGVKIAMIDTGVDWTHPSLGAGFGPGKRISFGEDLVGDDYDGTNDPVPRADPFSKCAPHGTHIAGIIAARAPQDSTSPFANVSGVAPGADLGVYRVFGCRGGTADDVLLKALQKACASGADVITMSIGSPAAWSDTPTARMATSIAAKGRIVTVSAGNDGDVGLYYQSSPSVAPDVMSVASVNSAYLTVYNASVSSGDRDPIPYYSANAFGLKDAQIWPFAQASDLTTLLDGCGSLPDSAPADLSTLVVIVRRGGCALDVKFRNLARNRVRTVLVANTGLAPFYPIGTGIDRSALIEAAAADWLVARYNKDPTIALSFPSTGPLSLPNKQSAGVISPFSSYGPTFDLLSSPSLAAPGDRILSTWPVSSGSWAILSGTSMACPHVAAAAALLLQAAREKRWIAGAPTHASPNLDVMDVRRIIDRLRSTAQPGSNSTRAAMLETGAKQGSGLLQVADAVRFNTSVSPGSLVLDPDAAFPMRRSFTVSNSGTRARTFQILHEPAGTALTYSAGSAYPNAGPAPLAEGHLEVTLTPRIFKLEPGASTSVSVEFAPPGSGVDKTTFPVLSGFLRIISSPVVLPGAARIAKAQESLTVSYLGIATPITSMQVLDRGFGLTSSGTYSMPVVLIGGDPKKPQTLPRAYTFLDGDLPVLVLRLLTGTRRIKIDLVEDLEGSKSSSDSAEQAGDATSDGTALPVPRDVLHEDAISAQDERAPGIPRLLFQAAAAEELHVLDIRAPPTHVPIAIPTRPTFDTPAGEIQPVDWTTSRVVGPIASSELLPRNADSGSSSSYSITWDGSIAGTPVPTGEYRIRISALKLGVGEPDAGQDVAEGGVRYDRWWSPIIRVQRAFDDSAKHAAASSQQVVSQVRM